MAAPTQPTDEEAESERGIGSARGVIAETRRVTVRRGQTTAVDQIDLSVAHGQVVSLIGPNGSGKTTLVKALLGLVPVAAGSVWIRPGLRIGYVPQRIALDPSLPVTVERFLSPRRRRTRRDLADALDRVGASHVMKRPVQAVSGGEFQRVLLARALLRDPELLVLDEPAQGVDITGQEEVYSLIDETRVRTDCGVLIVSHDLHLVMASTDHVVCMNHHVCCEGRPDAVAAHPAYLELFGEAGSHALAIYTHKHDHSHDVSGEPHDHSGASGAPDERRH